MRKYIRIVEAQGSWFNSFLSSDGTTVDVYRNPSRAEFYRLYAQYGVRGVLDKPGVLYVWGAYLATHNDLSDQLDLWGQRLEWFGAEGQGAGRLDIYWQFDYTGWPEFEDRQEVIPYVLNLPVIRRIGGTWEARVAAG